MWFQGSQSQITGLVVQERPDLADLGDRRTHQPLGVDHALGQAGAARGQQDLADAVARHPGISPVDRVSRLAVQQIVEGNSACDRLDIAGRHNGCGRLHRFQRRPEQRRVLDIDQARREAVADIADLGEILRHQRIGRRDRHGRDADLHRAELQGREIQAVVAQDRDRVVAVMAVVEHPLRDGRPPCAQPHGQVDPVPSASAARKVWPEFAPPAAQVVGHLHRIRLERRRVAQDRLAVIAPFDLQRSLGEPERREGPVLRPAGRRVGVGYRARVVHRACDTSTTTAIALSPAAQPVTGPARRRAAPVPRHSITRRRPSRSDGRRSASSRSCSLRQRRSGSRANTRRDANGLWVSPHRCRRSSGRLSSAFLRRRQPALPASIPASGAMRSRATRCR